MKPTVANLTAIAAFLMVAAAPQTAAAYIGPGAGITAIGTLVALVAALVLAVVGFLWYPIKRFRRALVRQADRNDRPGKGS